MTTARSKTNYVLVLILLASLLLTTTPALSQDSPGAAYGGPGRYNMILYADQTLDVGTVSIWNSNKKMMVQAELSGDWKIAEIQAFIGTSFSDLPTRRGNPVPGKFPYKMSYEVPKTNHQLTLDLKDDLGFSWGSMYRELRTPTFAVHADLAKLDASGAVIDEEGAWAAGPFEFEGSQWGWYSTYRLAHPRRGHFIDAPVVGLGYRGPTQQGVTDNAEGAGGFLFFPGEQIEICLADRIRGTIQAKPFGRSFVDANEAAFPIFEIDVVRDMLHQGVEQIRVV